MAFMLIALALVTTLSFAAESTPVQAASTSIQEAKPATSPATDELWEAARQGDLARITRVLDQGANVDAATRYGVTALTFAAGNGHLDAVKLLIARGADINFQDTFYGARAITWAVSNKHRVVAALLLNSGSRGASEALGFAIDSTDVDLAKAALASADLTADNARAALARAKKVNNAEMIALISAKVAALPASATPAVAVDPATLQSYVASYRAESGAVVTVALTGDQLSAVMAGQSQALTLVPTSTTTFNAAEVAGLTIAFAGRAGIIEQLQFVQGGNKTSFARLISESPAAPATAAAGATAAGAATPVGAAARTAPRPWPAFRGDNAAGNGDGQGAVSTWDVKSGANVRWKTPIPGISNASPIVWGNRIFVVSAVSSAGDSTFRTGLYGDVIPVADLSEHTWKMYCLDRVTGVILWERTAFTGLPKVKRHTKASQANSTPVTDGTRVVAMFGSIGLLAAWDMDGKPLWTKQLGVLNSGWFFDPDVHWGHSSSPIIYRDTVIVQADRQKESFLAAYNLATGAEVWRTDRDEISTWGTPTVFRAGGKEQIVTNGPKVRGYDAATGALLWTLGPNSEITVGTPVVGDGLVYVTGGYPPARPVYAIKPSASGVIALTKEQTTSEALAWSNDREGTYIPTPLFYDGILYTCNNNGLVTAYDGKTGERLYRARVGTGGAFSASPIAADGKLYFANEEGEVYVAKAGRTYEEVAKNQMDEVVMSTPAIADGVIVIRTIGHLYGIGEKAGSSRR